MNGVRNKITEAEYKMMNNYRDWYVWHESKPADYNAASIRDILEEWENSNQNLYQLLGRELIISKEISFSKSKEELTTEMAIMFDPYEECNTRQNREGWKFIKAYKDWIQKTFPIHYSPYWDERDLTTEQTEHNSRVRAIIGSLNSLVYSDVLAENVYNGSDFTITLPNGKDYMIRSGCKPMKPLAKIAEAFSVEGFEDFRICHSQVLNQKKTSGDLVLSIHPLDYWTMSDNECGWESCMSWRDDGGYRQGTVEMMNSPCVVVAYLNAKDPMMLDYHNNFTWSNKKWRCLFIVDKNVILSIKAYPY